MFPNQDYLYTLMLCLGFIACLFVFDYLAKKNGMLAKSNYFYSILAIISIGVGIGSAVLFQLIYDIFEHGWGVFQLYQNKTMSLGMTFMGGLIGGAACFLLGTLFFAKPEVKKDFRIVLQVAAPCICIAHAFGRIGCFCAGCCYGKVTDSFLGIDFPSIAGHEKYLPTQLFEAVFLFILFAITFKFNKFSLPIYMIAYSVFRFTIEFFRGDERGMFLWQDVLSPSQIQSIFLLIGGGVILYLYLKKHNEPSSLFYTGRPQPAAATEGADLPLDEGAAASEFGEDMQKHSDMSAPESTEDMQKPANTDIAAPESPDASEPTASTPKPPDSK